MWTLWPVTSTIPMFVFAGFAKVICATWQCVNWRKTIDKCFQKLINLVALVRTIEKDILISNDALKSGFYRKLS